MYTAGGKDDVVSLAKQYAEAMENMIQFNSAPGLHTKKQKEEAKAALAYVVEQMMFRVIIEVKS